MMYSLSTYEFASFSRPGSVTSLSHALAAFQSLPRMPEAHTVFSFVSHLREFSLEKHHVHACGVESCFGFGPSLYKKVHSKGKSDDMYMHTHVHTYTRRLLLTVLL